MQEGVKKSLKKLLYRNLDISVNEQETPFFDMQQSHCYVHSMNGLCMCKAISSFFAAQSF